MARQSGRANRGPAAAAQNRAAILAAARELFSGQGFRVPLSSIAQRAGVGQGVLYRHFPSRMDLAYAVFEDNFRELEELAAGDGQDRFATIWARLVGLTVRSTAFVELVVAARDDVPDDVGVDRLEALLAGPLRHAQAGGEADPGWTTTDLVLVLNMLYGVAVSVPGDPDAVRRARRLVDPRLVPRD
ncbi:MAG: helix-turn-helix domain-containing protein [Propionicimonas sp.]